MSTRIHENTRAAEYLPHSKPLETKLEKKKLVIPCTSVISNRIIARGESDCSPYLFVENFAFPSVSAVRRNESLRDFRAGEFSARYPVKFSTPAAGYHFPRPYRGRSKFRRHFLRGQQRGKRRGETGGGGGARVCECVFFFVLFSVLDFSIAARNANAAECPLRYSHARKRALFRGVSNPDALSLAAN